jgi:hypothetical protein
MLKTREEIIYDTLRDHEGLTGDAHQQKWICAGCLYVVGNFSGQTQPRIIEGDVFESYRRHVAAMIERRIKILDSSVQPPASSVRK